MDAVIKAIVGAVGAIRRAYERKWIFLGVFFFAFFASVGVLAVFDLLPNSPRANSDIEAVASPEVVATTTIAAAVIEEPLKVEIPSIKLAVEVSNPDSTAIEVLDRALHKGAVRYPTTAKLGEEGNVVLFGHSSYLPLVNNPAYKAFNDIQKLKEGQEIRVYGADTVYVYHVRSVRKEHAETGAIELASTGKVLTLATCNSFGAKEDRFIVTADFVESHPVAS